jgi:hypothetical protein
MCRGKNAAKSFETSVKSQVPYWAKIKQENKKTFFLDDV